jgi:Fur family ferric uptake transcriptional regulator
MTHQRQVILEEMKKNPYHPTADEVYEMVRRKLPKISLGTIYRNLDVLTSQGVIQKIETEGSQKRFDGNPQPHYHVRCIQCGTLEDVQIQPLPSAEEVVENSRGYEIYGFKLEFIGICPECKEGSASETEGDQCASK